MYVSSKDKIGPYYKVLMLTPDGDHMPYVYAANSDEGWYEEYLATDTGKLATVKTGDNRWAIVTRRVESAHFDIVDKDTGEVLAESR